MMFKFHRLLPPLLLALLAMAPETGAQAPKPTEAPRGEEYVTEKGFKSRVFEIKHRDPVDLARVLNPLGSGFKGATVLPSRDLKTITVRDFPENLVTMEEALKRLDVPEAPLLDVDLKIHVIVASKSDGSAGASFPAELKPVVDALRSTLNYRSYRMLTTLSQRAKDGTRGLHGGGVAALDEAAETKERPFSVQMEYGITQLSVSAGSTGPASVRLDGFKFSGWGVFGYEGRVELATDLTLKDGEQVVVGTSVIKDKGIILVVSAKVVR